MKKPLLPLVLALLLLAQGASPRAQAQLEPVPGEDADTDGWKFRSAVDEGKVPASDVIAKLREMLPRLTIEPSSDDTLWFDDLFIGACALADASELQELKKIALVLPSGDFRIEGCLDGLTAAMLRQEVRRLEANPQHVTVTAFHGPLPPCLEGASPALEEAWRLVQAVREACWAAMKAERAAQSPPGGDTEFFQSVMRRWMIERQPDAWRDLAKCEWREPCGTGSEILYGPRNRGILLSMLADGRMPEAVGASFMLMSGGVPGSEKISMSREIARMITALGLDWETFYAGSLLPGPGGDFSRNEGGAASVYDYHEHRPWSALAAFGSERGVRLVLEIIRVARLNARDTMEFLGKALGPEPPVPGRTVASTVEIINREQPRAPELRREVFAVASRYLQSTQPLPELVAALRGIPEHVVAELRTPLLVLAGHRSPAVSSAARKLLGEAGLADYLPAPAATFQPLRLRLMNRGEPLAHVNVRIRFEPRQDTKSDARTNSSGELGIALDTALDPAAIRFIEITVLPENNPDRDSVGLPVIPGLEPLPGADDPAPPGDHRSMTAPWFSMKIPISAQQSGIREVAIPLASLEVRLSNLDGGVKPERVVIRVTPSERSSRRSSYADEAVLRGTPGEGVTFSRLQPDSYTVTVSGGGLATVQVAEVQLPLNGVVVPVRLAPGYAATGKVVLPGGEEMPLPIAAKLFAGEKECPRIFENFALEGWTGLPAGKYRAVIEAEQEGAPEDRHGGMAVEFEVGGNATKPVDLGKIKLPPVP